MLRVTLNSTAAFKMMIDVLDYANYPDLTFHAKPTGLECMLRNSTHQVLCVCLIPARKCVKYEYPGGNDGLRSFTLCIAYMKRALRIFREEDRFSLEFDTRNPRSITMMSTDFNNFERSRIEIILTQEIIHPALPLPKMEADVVVSMKAERLVVILEDLMQFGNDCAISYTKNELKFSTQGDQMILCCAVSLHQDTDDELVIQMTGEESANVRSIVHTFPFGFLYPMSCISFMALKNRIKFGLTEKGNLVMEMNAKDDEITMMMFFFNEEEEKESLSE